MERGDKFCYRDTEHGMTTLTIGRSLDWAVGHGKDGDLRKAPADRSSKPWAVSILKSAQAG